MSVFQWHSSEQRLVNQEELDHLCHSKRIKPQENIHCGRENLSFKSVKFQFCELWGMTSLCSDGPENAKKVGPTPANKTPMKLNPTPLCFGDFQYLIPRYVIFSPPAFTIKSYLGRGETSLCLSSINPTGPASGLTRLERGVRTAVPSQPLPSCLTPAATSYSSLPECLGQMIPRSHRSYTPESD